MTDFSKLIEQAEEALAPRFREIEKISEKHTARILEAFRNHRVSESCFGSTNGYGLDDAGRDTLDKIYAEVFGCEAAFVRHSIVSGTHALTVGLFALLRPGDVLLSLTGKPYDTLDEVIGLSGKPGRGSLFDFGVRYREVALKPDGTPDYDGIARALSEEGNAVKAAFIQRSKGYLDRPTLTVSEIGRLAAFVKDRTSAARVVVDNCYGEFTEDCEPVAVGADLMIGSLIKNPGGGMAESGGYLAGRADAVELVACRATAPGIGAEEGATLGQNRNLYKGLFYAPHTVAQALKTMHLAAYLFAANGFEVEPSWNEKRSDIIEIVRCKTADNLIAFCRGIQAGSPVDAFVTCEPWDMPGYSSPVIMAAGTFVQGSSLELSADGPIRPPYNAYLQGGLTYESGKIGILYALDAVLKANRENGGETK